MKILVNVFNRIKSTFLPGDTGRTVLSEDVYEPILTGLKHGLDNTNCEIALYNDISDESIDNQQKRSKYIQVVSNPNHKVKSGETLQKIADKYEVSVSSIKEANNIDKDTVLHIGQVLKIPSKRIVKNIKTLNDVANLMGVSKDFVLQVKRFESPANMPDNKFQNTPYKDVGVETIGIGHVIKPGEKRKLSDKEVLEVFAKDLLKAEDDIIGILGRQNYNKLPQPIKEALLDMVFNKGSSVIEQSEGLAYCLRNGKYEAAINKMTYNKVNTVQKGEISERSGLSKRRLYDISLAIEFYGKKPVPQSNINTAQQVYNRGVELLRQECKAKGLKFENQIVGYNKDVQEYFGDKIELKYITK